MLSKGASAAANQHAQANNLFNVHSSAISKRRCLYKHQAKQNQQQQPAAAAAANSKALRVEDCKEELAT